MIYSLYSTRDSQSGPSVPRNFARGSADLIEKWCSAITRKRSEQSFYKESCMGHLDNIQTAIVTAVAVFFTNMHGNKKDFGFIENSFGRDSKNNQK